MTLPAEDYIAIQQLYARYAFAFDLRDIDAAVACYVESGELAFAHGTSGSVPGEHKSADPSGQPARIARGHTEIRALATAVSKRPEAKGYHWTSNLMITPTESGADCQCYLMFIRSPDGLGSVHMALYHKDQVVKVDGEWLFQRRMVHALPYDFVPTS